MLSFAFVYRLQTRGSNCFRKHSLSFLSRTLCSLFPFRMFKWHLARKIESCVLRFSGKFTVVLDIFGILGVISVPGQHVKFDYTDSCVFKTPAVWWSGGERLAGPDPDRLPSPSLCLCHTGNWDESAPSPRRNALRSVIVLFIFLAVFSYRKKYVNIYTCTAAEKVGLPFPAVLMQGLVLHRWCLCAKSHRDLFLMPGTECNIEPERCTLGLNQSCITVSERIIAITRSSSRRAAQRWGETGVTTSIWAEHTQNTGATSLLVFTLKVEARKMASLLSNSRLKQQLSAELWLSKANLFSTCTDGLIEQRDVDQPPWTVMDCFWWFSYIYRVLNETAGLAAYQRVRFKHPSSLNLLSAR